MTKQKREDWRTPIWPEIEKYLWWLAFVVILAWAFIELYALLLYVNIFWVNNEQWRLPGWYSFTIGALTRMTGFTLGTVWLGLMVWSERYLTKAQDKGFLRPRAYKMLGYSFGLGLFAVSMLRILPFFWGSPN